MYDISRLRVNNNYFQNFNDSLHVLRFLSMEIVLIRLV